MEKLIFEFICRALVVYALVTVLVYFIISPKMLFIPPTPANYTDRTEITKIKLSNNKRISAIYLNNPNAAYTILYSHGNAEDLGDLSPLLQAYYKHGFSVFAYDYQGYGTSDGSVSERNTYEDIEASYDFLTKQAGITPDQIILLGRSLGSGPSVYLAAKYPIGGLILESPFLSVFRVITYIQLFPLDRYPNEKRAKFVKSPVLIIHGQKDRVIPHWHGMTLSKAFTSKTDFVSVPTAGHNDLLFAMQQDYWQLLDKFAGSLN